ncbi:MAG: hypothetical protein NC218_09190 [Acetobacter sp.]|nr:hypothetical protein [Acetobacter sp.]
MKEYTGKQNGMAFKGIYTNSCMPNQKPKRVKKSAYQKAGEVISHEMYKIRMNLAGIASAAFVGFCAPLDTDWKVIIAALLVISSIHVEVESDE